MLVYSCLPVPLVVASLGMMWLLAAVVVAGNWMQATLSNKDDYRYTAKFQTKVFQAWQTTAATRTKVSEFNLPADRRAELLPHVHPKSGGGNHWGGD